MSKQLKVKIVIQNGEIKDILSNGNVTIIEQNFDDLAKFGNKEYYKKLQGRPPNEIIPDILFNEEIEKLLKRKK